MKLYEIDRQIEELIATSIDPETGELVIDLKQMAALQMEREAKIENVLLYYKDVLAEAKAVKDERDALAARVKSLDSKAESLKRYIEFALAGEAFKTPKVACTFRTTEAVEIRPEFYEWAIRNGDEYLRFKDPEPDKAKIKAAIKSGTEVPFAELVTKQSLTIK